MGDDSGNFTSMRISASGLSAQRLRMDIIAENIANASTTRTERGGPYRRKEVILRGGGAVATPSFDETLKATLELERRHLLHRAGSSPRAAPGLHSDVAEASIIEDTSEGHTVYDPSHPDADENGYVRMPNVQIVEELVGLMGAARAYEANLAAMRAAQDSADATLRIGA